MIPLYGFVQGDTMGLVVLAGEDDTIAEVARRLAAAASVRVAPRPNVDLMWRGRVLDPQSTVRAAGLSALERVDLVERSGGQP